MHPSLWNRGSLVSSYMTFSLCSRDQYLCSQANRRLFSRLASPISGFLKATQPFSPNFLSFPLVGYVEILLLSLLIRAPVSIVVFLRFDFTQHWISSSKMLVPHYPSSLNNAVYNLFRCFLCMMHAMTWPFSIRLKCFPQPHNVSSEVVETNERSCSLHQLGLYNFLPAAR